MKIYLAGPMRGYDNLNFKAFDQAAKELREAGHEVFSPADNDREKGYVGKSFEETARDCILDDLTFIIREADALALLPGWENSLGVAVEISVANFLNLPTYEMDKDGKWRDIDLDELITNKTVW